MALVRKHNNYDGLISISLSNNNILLLFMIFFCTQYQITKFFYNKTENNYDFTDIFC